MIAKGIKEKGILTKLLEKGIKFLVIKECKKIRNLKIDIISTSTQIFKGVIEKINISAEDINYKDLFFDELQIEAENLKINFKLTTKELIFTNNPVGTAKVCKKFEKDLKKLSAEAAFFDNQLYSKEDIAKVATLPSLDEIRGKIVGLINAPASKLVRLLQRPDQDIISILQNKKD